MEENEEKSNNQVTDSIMEQDASGKDEVKKPKMFKSDGSNGKPERNKYLLFGAVGFISALLVCVLTVCSFAIGYAVGNDGDHGTSLGQNRMKENIQRFKQQEEGSGTRLEGLKDALGVNVVRGKVSSIDGDKIVIDSPEGQQTVKITSATINRGNQEISAGKQVMVLIKEAEGQEPEATLIRVIDNNGGVSGGKVPKSNPRQNNI